MFSKVSKLMHRGGWLNSLTRQRSSVMQAVLDQTAKARQLPSEVSLQVLDERHDLNQIRNLLAQAFVVNNEPIVHVLGEIYYPTLNANVRIPLIEERFKSLFTDQSMMTKVEQGLSFVAVKDNDPKNVVSVMFAEKYTGDIYKGESIIGDPLFEAGLNLMRAVHKKAEPILNEHSTTRTIIFVSHTATHPQYRALGIFENLSDALRARMMDACSAVYCLTTSHRVAQFLMQRHGLETIAEVFYKDYEDNGHKVFKKLYGPEISAKALMICL